MDEYTLKPSRSGSVCMTCNHFRYADGKQCQSLLTCPIHQRLIPQGKAVTDMSCTTIAVAMSTRYLCTATWAD